MAEFSFLLSGLSSGTIDCRVGGETEIDRIWKTQHGVDRRFNGAQTHHHQETQEEGKWPIKSVLDFILCYKMTHDNVLGSGGYTPGEKRRKPMQLSNMTYVLNDSEILDDLKIINKNKSISVN